VASDDRVARWLGQTVAALTDNLVAVRVHAEVVREVELARVGARLAPRFDERAVRLSGTDKKTPVR